MSEARALYVIRPGDALRDHELQAAIRRYATMIESDDPTSQRVGAFLLSATQAAMAREYGAEHGGSVPL